nr:IS200/IS605 family transposase [Micromonospora musae]
MRTGKRCVFAMRDVCADFEAELVEFNGENNHVHLLVNHPPKVAVARLVNSLEGVSSGRLRQEFPDLVRHYYQANKRWSGSYLAGSVVLRGFSGGGRRGGPPWRGGGRRTEDGRSRHTGGRAEHEGSPLHAGNIDMHAGSTGAGGPAGR